MANNQQTSKTVFLRSLTEKEQMGTLYDWVQSLSNDQALNTREHIEFRNELIRMAGEMAGIGRRKEVSTSSKMNAIWNTRMAAWFWLRDKVLAGTLQYIFTIIIVAILYLTFGGKIP